MAGHVSGKVDRSLHKAYNKSTKKSTLLERSRSMTVAKQMEVRRNIKQYFDMAFAGDTILVPRKENKNVVVISQNEYEELQKAKRNYEYLAKIDQSLRQKETGETITFTMEELRAMESDDWKPTQKVLDFMGKAEDE